MLLHPTGYEKQPRRIRVNTRRGGERLARRSAERYPAPGKGTLRSSRPLLRGLAMPRGVAGREGYEGAIYYHELQRLPKHGLLESGGGSSEGSSQLEMPGLQ